MLRFAGGQRWGITENKEHIDMDMDHMNTVYRYPMPAPPGVPMSEFNHHLAGVIVFLVGLSAALMYFRPRELQLLKYVWPAAFLMLGIYQVLYGNPDGWPAAANVGLMENLQVDSSALQHELFGVILVLIGLIETARASRLLRDPKWRFAFPGLALVGAFYLVWHEHAGGEHMHMMSMTEHHVVRIQHMIYLALGVGIAVSKVIFDARIVQAKWFPYVWPSLMMLLGIALMLYRE